MSVRELIKRLSQMPEDFSIIVALKGNAPHPDLSSYRFCNALDMLHEQENECVVIFGTTNSRDVKYSEVHGVN
jgi:hypothetical protein